MSQHRQEPRGIKGSRLVWTFFIILAVISIVSYFVFKYVLNIPAA